MWIRILDLHQPTCGSGSRLPYLSSRRSSLLVSLFSSPISPPTSIITPISSAPISHWKFWNTNSKRGVWGWPVARLGGWVWPLGGVGAGCACVSTFKQQLKTCNAKFLLTHFKNDDAWRETAVTREKGRNNQCCGSEMIYSGSSFEFSEFRIQAKVPDPCRSGSGSNLY